MINHIEYFDVCYDKAEYKKNKKMLNLIYVNKEKRNYKIKIIKKLKRKLKKVGDKNVIFSKELKRILSESNIIYNNETKLIYKENIIQIINNIILLKRLYLLRVLYYNSNIVSYNQVMETYSKEEWLKNNCVLALLNYTRKSSMCKKHVSGFLACLPALHTDAVTSKALTASA